MNKKLMGLAFVIVVSGCHSQQQAAVCPAPEEEVAEPAPPLTKEEIENEAVVQREVERARARSSLNKTPAGYGLMDVSPNLTLQWS